MGKPPSRRSLGAGWITFPVFLWALNGVWLHLLKGEDPRAIVGSRFVLASFLLSVAAVVMRSTLGGRKELWESFRVMGEAVIRNVRGRTLPQFNERGELQLLTGVTAALGSFCWLVCSSLTNAAVAGVLVEAYPVVVVVLSARLFGERATARQWVYAWGCVLGVALFFADRMSVREYWGLLVGVLGCIVNGGSYISTVLLAKRLPDEPRTFLRTHAIILSTGVLGMALLPSAVAHPVAPGSWLPIVAMATIGWVLPQILYSYLMSRQGRYLTGMLLLQLQPIITAALLYAIFGVTLGRWALIGGAVVILCVVLGSVTRKKEG